MLDVDINFTLANWIFGRQSMMTLSLDYASSLSSDTIKYKLYRQPHEQSMIEQLILTPVWILIVSILVGTLIMAIITVHLIRVGFFKSRKSTPTVSESNLDTEEKLLPTPETTPLPLIKVNQFYLNIPFEYTLTSG